MRWLPNAIALLLLFGPFAVQGHAREIADMNGDEIKTLQQRLANAGCYAGEIDGRDGAALRGAAKACPDQEPTLRIETGMHIAQLTRIAVDARCAIAATSSNDKTVRLWSMPEGKPLRVQRLPIDAGAGGKVNAVAVSPDGRWIAAGVDDAHVWVDRTRGIYLFDAAAGANVRRIGAQDDAFPIALAFSPDGRWLAAAMNWGGLRVFNVATGALAMADQPFSRSSDYGVVFSNDGTLYAVGEKGSIARYDANLRRTAKIKAPHDKQAYSVALDPSGERLAVGYADAPLVDLFDARDLHWLGSPDLSGIDNGDLVGLAWSSHGQRLAGGGKFGRKINGAYHNVIRTWTPDGRLVRDDALAAADAVVNMATCGDAIAFANFDSGFGLLKPNGEASFLREPRAPIMEYKVGDAFSASPDGTRVDFGLGFGAQEPVIFDAIAGTLTDATAPPKDFVKPRVDGLPIKDWLFSEAPVFAGKPLKLERYESTYALAIRADRTAFALGTRGYIRKLDASGRQLWEKAGPAEVWGLNLAKDDSLIIAAYSEGTIRWQRWSDGQELLALFVDAKDRRWVAWTPSGYYMASSGGEDLIGWQVNRGWEQQADFFPASRFRERFNRPDIVRLVLATLDEGEAVRRANEAARRHEAVAPLTAELPPVIRIDGAPAGGTFATPEASIGYGLRSPSGLAIDRIDVLIDGRPAKEIGLPLSGFASGAERLGSLKVSLPPRDVEIGLIAWSGDIASEAARVRLKWAGAPAAASGNRRLRALVAGVSDYASPEMRLDYAAKDARDFAGALERQKGGYYGGVDTRVIVDRDVTRSTLIDGLEWLEKSEIGPDDVTIVFLAGHGLTDEKQTYWFLPSDATEEQARAKGLSQEDVRRSLKSLPGKVLWFLDTCHAGAAARRPPVDVNVLVNTITSAENGGIVAFASSTGTESSVESSAWKNGAFTKAIIEGVDEGKAGFGGGLITTSLLDAYLAVRVKELTNDKQHPVMNRPPQEPDFAIAQVRKP